MKNNQFPFISIVVLNYNGYGITDLCLASLFKSKYPAFEVIVVDNASWDGSLELIEKIFSAEERLIIIRNTKNLYFAEGNNVGIRQARGEYIIILNNDTEVEPNWLIEFLKVLEKDKAIGAAQAKLLRMGTDNFYDCAGDYLGPLGFLIERSRGAKDVGQFDFIADILSAKSAASIIRRGLFEKIGGFDDDFYMYLEETDLSWRVWLVGFRVVFIPGGVVYHTYGAVKKTFKKYYQQKIVIYYGCRNYITTLIKNLGFVNLAKILPLHILLWFAISVMFIFKREFKKSYWIITAIVWNIINCQQLLKKRNSIQRHIRQVSDAEILENLMVHRKLGYYIGKAIAYIYGRSY